MSTRGSLQRDIQQSDREALADKLAQFHRISWRQALGRLVAPVVRVHQYRDLHTAMLYDALCEHDCGPCDE